MKNQRLAENARVTAAAAALRRDGATEVYLFGSFAEGRARADSDLDLAVLGLPADRFYAALARASDAAGIMVDVVCLEDDTPFIRALKTHGGLRRVA